MAGCWWREDVHDLQPAASYPARRSMTLPPELFKARRKETTLMTSAKEGQFLAFMEIHNAFNKKGNKMILRRVILTGLALAAGLGSNAWGQAPPATILTIEMENAIQYQESFANPQMNGTSTTMEAKITAPATFFPGTFIADIAAINGVKVKGATVARIFWVGLNTNPSGSQAISDANRFQAMDISLEIQQADGRAVGTIVLSGVTGGAAPVGAPKAGVTGTFAVIGGTGAFLGARGQAATILNTHRATSTLENPINRRTF